MSLGQNRSEYPYGRVAILGLGVMGGSLARALSELERAPHVVGWSRKAAERENAVLSGAIDTAPDEWMEAVGGADLVVLATPLKVTCQLLGPVSDAAPDGATFTDVASLKGPVVKAALAAGVTDRWIGSHPMAGSEDSGFEASKADLYNEARVWIVANSAANSRVLELKAFWQSVGAEPSSIEAADHDRLVAMTSHLPQLAANALASILAQHGIMAEELGPGGRDMTRLAASGAAMWRDLLEESPPELVQGLRSLSEAANAIADQIEEGDLEELERLMRSTAAWRRST